MNKNSFHAASILFWILLSLLIDQKTNSSVQMKDTYMYNYNLLS